MPEYHKPVLLYETLELLNPKDGGTYLDATVGGGGHSAEVLKRIGPAGTLIGIDRDSEALEYARRRLSEFDGHVILVQGNYSNLSSILESVGVDKLDGAIFDLGVSSHQLDAARGFSFMRDEELDMRMSRDENTPTAADIVNSYREEELAAVIWRYGEERYSRRIARAIVRRRAEKPITHTHELVDIIISAVPGGFRRQEIHPATRTFQAIRIEVNHELESVEQGVSSAIDFLKIGGRICVISFHSLEDRIIKTLFRRLSGHCECPPRLPICQCGAKEILRVITRKPVVPGAEEITANPRSRSSKLRAAERIA